MSQKISAGRCVQCGNRVWVVERHEGAEERGVCDWWCDNEGCDNREPVQAEAFPLWVNRVAERRVAEELDPKTDPASLFVVKKEKGGKNVSTEGPSTNDWAGKGKRDLPLALVSGDERFQVVIPECCATCSSKAVDSFYNGAGGLVDESVYCSLHGYVFENLWDDVFRKCGDYSIGAGVAAYCQKVHLGLVDDFFERIHEASTGPGRTGWMTNGLGFGDEAVPRVYGEDKDPHLRTIVPKEWVPDGLYCVGSPVFPVDQDGVPVSSQEWDEEGEENGDKEIHAMKVEEFLMDSHRGTMPTIPSKSYFEERVRGYLKKCSEVLGIKYILGFSEKRDGAYISVYARGCKERKE